MLKHNNKTSLYPLRLYKLVLLKHITTNYVNTKFNIKIYLYLNERNILLYVLLLIIGKFFNHITQLFSDVLVVNNNIIYLFVIWHESSYFDCYTPICHHRSFVHDKFQTHST